MSGFTIQVNNTTIEASSTYNALQVYNCLVDVVRVTRTVEALGNPESLATLVANMPCRIRWTSGKERMLHDKTTHFIDATLHCRKVAGITITTKDRILYNGKYYEITDVQDFRNLGRLLVISLRKIE